MHFGDLESTQMQVGRVVHLSWQLQQQLKRHCQMQQLQQQLQMSHGSCGSHSSTGCLAGVCQRKLQPQMQPRQSGGSGRAHHRSSPCHSRGCSCAHIRGHSHL